MRFTAFDATNVEGLPAVPEAAARTWSYPQYPYRIECASAVLEEIRREAESGRASRAGREMGGVLFGVQKSDSIHILACRLLPCEHAMGPGFVLSKKDEDCLAQLIASPGRDPALHGLLPLGWYHSHIHSRICLSERDRQLHFRYFDAPYQIAMVIRCSAERPARAGFFFREPSGAMYTESSYEEFTIDAPPCARPALPQPSTPRRDGSPLGASTPEKKTGPRRDAICPKCGSRQLLRSRRTGLRERICAVFGFQLYRCHECLSRSFLKTSPSFLALAGSRRRRTPEARKRAWQRTRRELLFWGGGILGFLALLHFLTRDSDSKADAP